MTTNEAKRQVIRAAQQRGLDVVPATRRSPGVLVMDWRSGFGRVVAEGDTWQAAHAALSRALAAH